MTRRQDNPILLWLTAEAWGPGWMIFGHSQAGGRGMLLDEILDVCRWLDAEDEWLDTFELAVEGHLTPAAQRFVMWRQARMAEAGVL